MATEARPVESGRDPADLTSRIAAWAAAEPDRVAIEDGDRRLTYAELDAAAGSIASALQARGLGEEDVVGVCIERSWQAVCSFLGVVRAGAAYVPIDPAHPADRRRSLLALAGASAVVTVAGQGSGLPGSLPRLDADSLAAAEPAAPPSDPRPGDRLAYVLFTSGSTGRPKGVEVTHANLVDVLCSGAPLIATAEDVALHVVPLSFDLSAQEIWGALLNGARLAIAPPGPPDPAEIGRLIGERGVTAMSISTGLFHELVRAEVPELARLRLLAAGGDVLTPALAAELRRRHPAVRLFNSYGPTETTILCSYHEVREVGEGPVPIGRPLPGFRLRVCDEEGHEVPPGEAGELWIGGVGVARGYRGDPQRTAEAFRTAPDGERMYRSGDRVMMRADGELVFLGRLDDQVKIDGQRVEPGEVARVLESHPAVRQAAVVAREDVPGHKRLVGYAVRAAGADPSEDELRGHLAERLPAFMVPRVVLLLDELPVNERGKVDRGALPAPGRDRAAASDDPVAALMAEVLGLEAVGPDEDFFALGGTSLLAIQLVGRLRDSLGADVGIEAVFEAPTPRGLAERVAESERQPPALPPLAAGPAESVAPLSAAQRRAWLFGRMRPDSIAYQFAAIFRFEGPLDPEALRKALGDLIDRHEILRTSFVERDGEPVQLIHDGVEPDFELVDLRSRPHAGWAPLVRSRVRTRIDPGRAPLLRWTLARLAEERWCLIHVEHHLVHDGWSFAVLAGELAELYSARIEERAPDLPRPAVQFRDYARWERRARASAAVREQIERWTKRLDPDPPLIELPGARPRPARESFAGGAVRRRIGGELAGELKALARDRQATLFMVALAAFLVQLHRYSGRDDIQVGSGLANRGDPSAELLIGMIVNTVGLRVDLGGDPTVEELLRRVRRVAIEAYADADAPFDEVVEAIGPPRDPRRSPLIQALFSFHDSPRGAESWAGLRAQLLQGVPNGTGKADLNVIGVPGEDRGFTFLWEHSDLLDDAAADRMAGHHVRLLEQFVASPEARISELDLVPDEERQLLAGWRQGPALHDRAATIHGLVRRRAAADPDAPAVVEEHGSMSYDRLLSRAERVAGALIERGVASGDRVGVLVSRSSEMVAAKLGILLAGAAYVPLDPLHPAARIARALADADARLVLADASSAQRLPAGVMALDVGEAARAETPPALPDVRPGDLAYVMYTSGSTGDPKGVEVTHGNVVRLVDRPSYVDLGPGRVMLNAASPAFDATTLELWGPLANGGAVAPLPGRPSPDAVAAAIAGRGVNVLWLTAGLFHELVDRRPDCLAGVDHLLAGGDVLSRDHVERALAALPAEGRLTNGYGPTEATTFALTHTLRPGEAIDSPTVPIGRPIGGTTCTVVEPTGHEAPIGVPGELVIGGDGVARGYRGDPDLTRERFVEDPRPFGGRAYRTGDLVRRRADGALEFLGRLDRQLKIRGHRVEPAEVEQALREHPAIADAAVVGYERAPGDLALAAYTVAAAGARHPDAAALRAHAEARLPAAMVPTAWIEMPELPLGATGKVDRGRLPEPTPEHLAARKGRVGPRNRRQRRVVRAFERVLDVRPVGIDDDFFALGGHSLLAVSLIAELERVTGRRLPLAIVFEAPTPRALAAALGDRSASGRWSNLVPLKPTGSRPPLFVVAAGDGNIVGFAPLARHIEPEQPLYGLQPTSVDGRHPLDQGIEQMAARYLEQVRAVRPHGPYLLAGRCNGATVAFEMARQLVEAGEEVPLLVSLDSDPPPAGPFDLGPGLPYDQVMEAAILRARREGEAAPDPDADRPEEIAAWLRAPLAGRVSRYLHEFWRWRRDLREALPDPLGADARALAHWAWEDGIHQGLSARLLLPSPSPGCETVTGEPWDWAADAAWEARGRAPADPLSAPGWGEMRAHLTEPVGGGLNRYLLAAAERTDLRAAFPRPLGDSAPALLDWAWRDGVREGLQEALLPPPAGGLPPGRRLANGIHALHDRADRAGKGARRRLAAAGAEARAQAIEGIEALLRRPLPGARWRIERRVLAAARRARASYRCEPLPGRVTLVTSTEFADKPTYPAWEERAAGGVDVRPLPLGHVEMLRDPGAAQLARCLERAAREALAE